jgi:hypothetical protein
VYFIVSGFTVRFSLCSLNVKKAAGQRAVEMDNIFARLFKQTLNIRDRVTRFFLSPFFIGQFVPTPMNICPLKRISILFSVVFSARGSKNSTVYFRLVDSTNSILHGNQPEPWSIKIFLAPSTPRSQGSPPPSFLHRGVENFQV